MEEGRNPFTGEYEITIAWRGGELSAEKFGGEIVRRIRWGEPITATSDSHAIAHAILGDIGEIVGAYIDGDHVHAHIDPSQI